MAAVTTNKNLVYEVRVSKDGEKKEPVLDRKTFEEHMKTLNKFLKGDNQ